ncbi:MAG: PKD domain-containing protein [Candidatus Thermoplasmatota archaeon]|nr:PKD domain-containing protein [Candidatus Thermoplasmatota archaeon]
MIGSSEPSRDSFDNDSFETADDIFVRVEPWEGSLDPTDAQDFYLLLGLEGDNENDQRNTQLIRIGLQKDSGSAVKAVIYEPNMLEIAYLVSDGSLDELEFIVPRDGGFFIEVTTETKGQTSSYGIYLGGETDVNNNELHDKNNVPPGTGLSDNVKIADSLDPRGDLVDYWQITIPGYRALEVELSFLAGLPFHLQVLDENMTILDQMGSDDPFIIESDVPEDQKVILRVYLLLSNDDRPVGKKSYYVNLVVWSYLTRPQIDPMDTWSVIQTNEDMPIFPPINLSNHFFEPNNDTVQFELLTEPENLVILFNYTIIDQKLKEDLVYVEVEIYPMKDWFGTETLVFRCSDRDGDITDTVEIQVNSVNDLPYITRIGEADFEGGAFNMFALEDIQRSYNISYHDEDDPIENIHFSSNESFDFLSIEPGNGTVTIDAVQRDVGNYWFSLEMSDGHDTVITDINLDIQHVNDAPPDPEIIVLKGNVSSILPGQEVKLKVSIGPDIDGDELLFTWNWGDGKTDDGDVVSHTYAEGIYGNRTVKLTVSDGYLQKVATLKLYLEKPEDIASENVEKILSDPSGDVVKLQEEWRLSDPDSGRKFIVSKVAQPGVDIISLRGERRGNNLQISLRVKDSIQIDGSFHYYLYILDPAYVEPFVDFRNISGWNNITSRHPDREPLIFREYVGDPALHNESTGIIVDQHTLVWVIPLMELNSAGLDLPIDGENFTIFAVTEHVVSYRESKGFAERYLMTDTIGTGALFIGDISSVNSTSGGGSSPFADLSRPTTIGVVVGLIITLILVVTLATLLLRKQIREKKKEEDEFIRHVEKMNEEGKDLFGKDREEKADPSSDFEKIYGSPKLESFMQTPVQELEDVMSPDDVASGGVKVKWDEDGDTNA